LSTHLRLGLGLPSGFFPSTKIISAFLFSAHLITTCTTSLNIKTILILWPECHEVFRRTIGHFTKQNSCRYELIFKNIIKIVLIVQKFNHSDANMLLIMPFILVSSAVFIFTKDAYSEESPEINILHS
jgi:hypothetical protein